METLTIILNLISEKGINEQRFLKDMSFSRSLLSEWKSGKNKSYTKHINKIADYFNVSTDYLLGKTNNPKIDEQPKGYNVLSADEIEILKAYNALDERGKNMIRGALGLSKIDKKTIVNNVAM